ncbi:MAG: ABC transporter permease [Candidatus Heimdallarchaeota archaeon]|nr:ABC transporter permease [Candidatus Heimdallarchaeota archaeon]
MKIQTLSALTKKELKKNIRIPGYLFLTLIFPLILTLAFGLAFGSFGTGETTYSIGVVDLDNSDWSDWFKTNLSDSEVMSISSYDDIGTAVSDLQQGRVDAVVIIPTNFGQSCDSFWADPITPSSWYNATVDLYVDEGSLIVSNAIPPLIQQIIMQTLYGEDFSNTPQPIQLGTAEKVDAEHFTQFDFMAPGMFAFAAIFTTMIIAESFTEERATGLLNRIQVTPTTPSEIITSTIFANTLLAIVQVSIIFIMAGIMGFTPKTEFLGFFIAFVLVLLLVICNIGFGLITATIVNSPGAATGVSFIFILPQMFLGTFVPISEDLGRLVPSFYVTDALTSLFLRGAPALSETILIDVLVVSIFCLIVTIIGIILFTRFGKD